MAFGGMAGCWLALVLAPRFFTQHWPFQALFALAFGCYCWALMLLPQLRRLSPGAQLAIVLGGILLLGLPLLFAPLVFSDDLFRYIWNGRVSAAGIDPYAYAPGDAALAPLRDAAIWPHINAKLQASPYPPLLEALFALVYRVAPERPIALRLTMLLLNLAASAVLAALLRRRGGHAADALIYAWNPAVVFQVGLSAHNEPLMLLCLLLALWAWGHSRHRRSGALAPLALGGTRATGARGHSRHRRSGTRGQGGKGAEDPVSDAPAPQASAPALLSGFFLGLAVLAKLVPVLALPALARRSWRAALVCVLTVAAVYGALLLRGQRVLAGVLAEANTAVFNDGAHLAIARIAARLAPHAADTITGAVSAGLLLLCVLWAARRATVDMARPIGIVLAAYIVLAASVAPWYVLWVLPFVALDALPQPWRGPGARQTPALLLSYWIIFSWSVTFSELFYFEPRLVWILAHLLVYALPLLALGLCAWWGRTRGTIVAEPVAEALP